jgi:hypothetical protein
LTRPFCMVLGSPLYSPVAPGRSGRQGRPERQQMIAQQAIEVVGWVPGGSVWGYPVILVPTGRLGVPGELH